MTKFANALTRANVVTKEAARKASSEADRQRAFSDLCRRVREACAEMASATSAKAREDATKRYLSLKSRLPAHLKNRY
jgi:hypothetical protein